MNLMVYNSGVRPSSMIEKLAFHTHESVYVCAWI